MFSRQYNRFLLFKIIDREPSFPSTKNFKHRSAGTNIRFDRGQDDSNNNNNNYHTKKFHREQKFGADQDNFGQRKFENLKKRGYGDFGQAQAPASRKPENSNKNIIIDSDAGQQRRVHLSRLEALHEASADKLRSNTISSLSDLDVSAAPRKFQELSQEGSLDPLLSFDQSIPGRGRDQRREALRKMKIVALEEKERRAESDKNFRGINVMRGDSTNPELKQFNDEHKNWTAIAETSELAQSTIFRNKLSSRRNMTTWDVLDRTKKNSMNSQNNNNNNNSNDLFGSKSNKSILLDVEEDVARRSTSREWEKSEAHYKTTFDESTNLEHQRDSVQHSRSIYSQRNLPIPGLFNYHSFLTRFEEKQIAAELTKLLMKPIAAYHASEGRYCVNLFEKELHIRGGRRQRRSGGQGDDDVDDLNEHQQSIPSVFADASSNDDQKETDNFSYRDPSGSSSQVAFSISKDAPTLHSAFQRAARLGLIPAVPNVVQVSEMVTPYSGYAPHLKHASIGDYCGVFNLISNAQMDFVHVDQPWSPKILMIPRALYVMDRRLLSQFRVGYNRLDYDTTTHQDAARFTKDYRLEVMFATVDAERVPRLAVPVKQSLKKEADVVFQQHNFRKAIELYTNAINADPSSELTGTLFSNRSLCHHKLGNFHEALNDGISATTLKPKWARGYLRVAVAYESLGKEDEAIEAYQKSLDFEENEETRRSYIALFRKNVDNMKKTQEELKVIGNGYVQKKKYDEAVIIYNASIDLDPSIESAAPIYSNRSLAFFNLGRFKEAEDDGCMSIFLKPEFTRGYLRRAMAEMKLEKWKESFEAFEKYFVLDPENAKSDPELVKNKNSVKKAFDQNEDEKRKRETMMAKTRAEIMAIKNETERKKKALSKFEALAKSSSFNVPLARVLVECGADLAPTGSQEDEMTSILVSLVDSRVSVPPKILPEFDELLFFIIDEMVRRDVPFIGWELYLSCNKTNAGVLNPKILRVLLETKKFDVNRNFGDGRPAPLVSLVMGMMQSLEMPPEAPDCLHLLLNWKGIDVNATSRIGTKQLTAIGFVRHPEVAKILIRYGANVNAVTSTAGELANVLDNVLCSPDNSDLEELIRVLIRAGARLLANGKDGKSSQTIMRMLSGVTIRDSTAKKFLSEEVLRMILQLNQHQGLLFRWQHAASETDVPFLLNAIYNGSPFRYVELLFSMTSAPMKETGKYGSGQVMTIADALANQIRKKLTSFDESIRIFGFLLEHGLDLFEPIRPGTTLSTFVALCNICNDEQLDLNLLKKTIIEKRDEREFQRCMKTLK